MIRIEARPQNATLPLQIAPEDLGAAGNSAPALTRWVRSHLEEILDPLYQHGALLFRGFSFSRLSQFEEFAGAFTPQLANYIGGNSPRKKVSGNVYTSTEFSAKGVISQHNECSDMNTMPGLVFFYCGQAPTKGGQTPLSDSRNVFKKIRPEVRHRFSRHGLKYVNNLHTGFGFGRSWQEQFQTRDRRKVEAYLQENGYEYEWKPSGGLRTSVVCDAVKVHPVTGEEVWINQAEVWHLRHQDSKMQKVLFSTFDKSNLPLNVYFGDGSPIPESDLDHIREVLEAEKVLFDWVEGDVLVCDNYLTAHGREPYEGPRKV
ncbi:MAG: TauD/TfdA family dioxygenase, partial [Nitrospinaceae bacterium]